YTDRPIYRPGQTVYFRAVVRQEDEARYSLPQWQTVSLTITDGNYNVLAELELPLSPFGTAAGTYQIPASAQPGYFGIQALTTNLGFQVAEYRKPEIDLQVSMEPNQVLSGQTLSAQVAARYFFDVPAAGLPLEWSLYARPDWLALPGYSVGDRSPGWTEPFWMTWDLGLGEALASGSGRTGPDGLLQVDLPAQTVGVGPQQLVLEVTVRDESEFPLSARAEAYLHPAEFYIGIRPDQWIGQAERELGYQVQVVDWLTEPAGERDLTAAFSKVTWLRQDPPNPYAYPTYTPQYTPISQVDFFTGADGVARLGFIPPEAGTYQLEISGSGARSTSLVWVGGAGQAAWPRLPNDRLELVSDRDNYQPGDTATVFIPNPFGANGRVALVTMERGQVLRHQVLTLAENGASLEIELTEADAPNIYLAVTLIGQDGGRPAFRQGYLELAVAPQPLVLNVVLTAEPQRTGPQGEVIFDIQVSDAAGQPVQGEFSLAVVDAAVLALAEPNAPDIVSAFYGQQPLRVRTALGLTVYAQRLVYGVGGMGGGGDGDMLPTLREDFPDTAFWDAQIVTDANGQAQVTVTLPDNLTTWQVLLRGLTADTRVGEALSQVITTKDLLVRPVTPRFVVLGDHLRLASIVHNNTAADLTATVNLAAAGFVLDDPNQESQTVTIPAAGRVVVYWWGTVSDVPALDLIFSARSGDLQDATRPVWGELPVLRYTAPQTFATAGTLTEGGQRLEVVSLPRSFDPNAGELRLQLSPSLAAAIEAGLEVLEHYPYECTEQTLSRFLPNLETYRAIQELGLTAPALQARLERTLAEGVARLVATQNADGGWSWWPAGSREQASDEYITAYVLFGLSQARQAGVSVDGTVLQTATDFLLATLPSLEMLSSNWQFDRLAFVHFALVQAGSASQAGVINLYTARDRLSPAGQAFLALSLEALFPGDSRARSLVDNLEAGAIRTATGAHWQGNGVRLNLDSPLFNSAVVVYTLAQFNPASPTLAEAVRYLMANRDVQGAWQTTYQTAWVILALNEVMQGTGELAGDFAFSASLNGQPWLQGSAGGDARLNPVSGAVPLSNLYPADPNGLWIERQPGPGRLYYSAYLEVSRPVEQVEPLARGISILREYALDASGRISISGQPVTVRVIFTLAQDSYHLVVEDYIPAGAEILDTSLLTSQLGADQSVRLDGWGWWYFNAPLIFDDHIAWTADYLPAGTYELSYLLVPTQPGEYRVLPARAWEFYFPEVQGSSAGAVVTIED
ncbi:MAG: hypothetical protein JW862_13095, partial [Anaerolineales bacterium]|nr:hypothetical protein [Anaerolineales bacterium]